MLKTEQAPNTLTAFLVFQTGPSAGQHYLLDKATLIIGRLETNDIVINDTRVSRRHAQLCRDDFRYLIEDLGSTNGTWLNGARLAAPAHLRHGDHIQIADIVMAFNDPNTTAQTEAFQTLALDEAHGQVVVAGQPVKLTAKELALMRLLYEHAGKLCAKDAIAGAVWPEYQGNVTDYNIEGLISRLRRKIEPDPDAPIYLHTHRGLGYMLTPGATAQPD